MTEKVLTLEARTKMTRAQLIQHLYVDLGFPTSIVNTKATKDHLLRMYSELIELLRHVRLSGKISAGSYPTDAVLRREISTKASGNERYWTGSRSGINYSMILSTVLQKEIERRKSLDAKPENPLNADNLPKIHVNTNVDDAISGKGVSEYVASVLGTESKLATAKPTPTVLEQAFSELNRLATIGNAEITIVFKGDI